MTEPTPETTPETASEATVNDERSRPTDATRRRFQELLAAKKAGGKGAGATDGSRREVPGRPSEAKGSRGFTRRKV